VSWGNFGWCVFGIAVWELLFLRAATRRLMGELIEWVSPSAPKPVPPFSAEAAAELARRIEADPFHYEIGRDGRVRQRHRRLVRAVAHAVRRRAARLRRPRATESGW
jgi:hypothetical protein